MVLDVPPDDYVDGGDTLGAVLIPGFILLPLASVIALFYLVWACAPSRREWIVRGPAPTQRWRSPTPRERHVIAHVARAFVVIAAVSPGILYLLLPPVLLIVVTALVAIRQITRFEGGETERSNRVSAVWATLGVLAVESALYVTLLWIDNDRNGGLIVFCAICAAGLFGFLAIARQFAAIRAIDLAGYPVSAKTETTR
jgi:hypothetical protein